MRIVFYSLGVPSVLLGIIFIFKDAITPFFFTPTANDIAQNTEIIQEVEQNEIESEVNKNTSVSSTPEVIASNLSVPWDVAFLPNGDLLITERTGSLVHIDRSGVKTSIPVPDASSGGEGGLLGLALHPEFASNNLLYLYMTTNSTDGLINRVVRYAFENNSLKSPVTIIDAIPGARYHDGGRIAFGPDGHLYITAGDAGVTAYAQDTSSLAGKILRLNDDGSVPSDNPFQNEVYSYGHRNPQGLAWDNTGQLWSTEHGRSGAQSGFDELNKIEKGSNYGWPESQGDTVLDGTIAPVIHSGSDSTWAPASLAYNSGHFFWGGLRGEGIYIAEQTSAGASLLSPRFFREYGRIRTVLIGPDGYLYFTTSNTDGRGRPQNGDDKLYRIHPDALL